MTNTTRKSIVIVEDEHNIARAEELILKDKFDVHLVHDGAEGLSKIKEIKPDLVVLDVMLPNMDGFEVCKKVREDAALSATKIVMVTAKNQDKDEAEGMELGADDYIMKPFEPVELMHVVNQILK
jgi:DNA-binding response OmpR family regulator